MRTSSNNLSLQLDLSERSEHSLEKEGLLLFESSKIMSPFAFSHERPINEVRRGNYKRPQNFNNRRL